VENTPIVSDVNPLCPDQISLNETFSIKEMEAALVKCRSKCPGPDGIPYCFIHNLGNTAKNHLLHIYNTIWRIGTLPGKWKSGIIIPILKPGKNKHSVDGYRPITLLNTMTKIMEKMVNTRLIWFLEKNKIIHEEQSGFRQSRSTINNLHIIKL
jgi:hypothetical protein